MLEGNQMGKQIAFAILQDIDFSLYPKQFLRCIMVLLDLEETKIYQKSAIADKIVQIHENNMGQYNMHLLQNKFRVFNNTQAKEFIWNIFKQYDDRLNQRKMHQMSQPKTLMHTRQHMPTMTTHLMPPNQNMNMSMVNMFLEVPNFQSVEQIQVFQRKMFEIYKNMMPQVLNSVSMSTSSTPYYRGSNSYQSYNMGGMSSMNPLTTMSGMGGMPGMSSMSGMSGMSGMGMGGMSSMNQMGNMGYSQKHNDYYQEPSSYQNPARYFYDKMPAKYSPGSQQMQRNQKNMMGDYRPMSNPNQMQSQMQSQMPNLGFSYYGQRMPNQDFRGGFKGMGGYSHNRISSPSLEFERKQTFSQRVMGLDDNRIDSNFMSASNIIDYPMVGVDKPYQKITTKQRQPYLSAPQISFGQEPRKMMKKDDEVSIFNDDNQIKNQTQNQTIKCICNSKKQDQVCYYCRIINLDPLNQVDQVLKLQKIVPQKNQISFTIGPKTLQKINKDFEKLDIQIRCIKLQKDAQIQNAWPERSRLSIDQEVIQQYLPAQSATIKKKKQRPIIFHKQFGNQKYSQDSIQILLQLNKNAQKPLSTCYLIGLFVVIKHTKQKMFQKMIQNIKQQNVTQFFKKEKSQPASPQQIVISPLSPINKKLMREPVRGIYCTHAQCFDLKIYIQFLYPSPNRQWKCPICSKDVRKVVSDNTVKNLLSDISKMIQQPKQIIFYASGAHVLKYNQNQQQNKLSLKQGGGNSEDKSVEFAEKVAKQSKVQKANEGKNQQTVKQN